MTTHTSGAADLPEALRNGDCGFWQWHPEIHPQGDHSMQALTDGDKRYGWREAALAAGQAVAPAEPTPDELRAIAREARNSSGSASDDCGSAMYVLYGWRAAISKVTARPAPPAMDGGEDAAMEAHRKNGLAWAVHRWEDEVKHRPLQNVHRRSLDDTWRQVVRYFGGDPDALLGPCHDAARAAQKGGV